MMQRSTLVPAWRNGTFLRRKITMLCCHAALLACLSFPCPGFAQQPKGVRPLSSSSPAGVGLRPVTHAVVIGISDYQDPDISDLRFADADARAFAQYLRSPAGGSLDDDHLTLLINEKATAGHIAEALDALVEQVKEGEQAIIYFSGHGDVERKTVTQPGFLLCWDAPPHVYMGGGTYSLTFLQEIISTIATRNKAKVVLITDACHAGKLAGSAIGGAQATTANLARPYANEVKILSCQPDEYSLEGEQWGGGRGVFSFHLVDALYGLADRNGDAGVTVGEIDRYLEEHVTPEAAPQIQVPMLLGSKSECLAAVNPVLLAELQRFKASDKAMMSFSPTQGRGLEDEVLARVDSNIRARYFAFKKALTEKRFFEPEKENAEALYTALAAEPGLAPLQGFLTRSYAAALQDDAQQVLNKWLKTDIAELDLSRPAKLRKYGQYPRCLARAAELLGPNHYMYAVIQARRKYFEAYLTLLSQEHPDARTGRESMNLQRQALRLQPDMPQAYLEMSQIWGTIFREPDSANAYAMRAAALAPSWLLPYTNMAVLYSRDFKQPANARKMLDLAARIDSGAMILHNARGVYYIYQKQFAEAEACFRTALRLDSSRAKIYANLGNLYLNMHRVAEGAKMCQTAIRLDSSYVVPYVDLGNAYREARRYEQAEATFRKALALDSFRVSALNGLGSVYWKTKRYLEAEQLFRKVLALDSTDATAWANLATLYQETGRMEAAEPLFLKAIQGDPTRAPSFNNLANLYVRLGRHAEAEQQYRKAIELDQQYTLPCYNLACMYSLQNKPAQALPCLEQALKRGWKDVKTLESDPDLAPVRALPEWKGLMQQYFPDQGKD